MASKFYQNNRTPYEDDNVRNGKRVVILEEPMSNGCRFRYKNEERSASPIKGANTTEEITTYPTIKIEGYLGPAVIVVSLITADGPPYFIHPNKLIGESCRNGVFCERINNPEMICSFSGLSIQSVKSGEVEDSLRERLGEKIDPYGTGFPNSTVLENLNYAAVRLCFQVILPDSKGQFSILLSPKESTVIYDSKTVSKLVIVRLSHDSAPITGGQEMILLCSPLIDDDVEIVFHEENDKEEPWIARGKFSPAHDVHHKVAIVFKTPAYKNTNIEEDVHCFIYLRQGKRAGKPVPFILRKEGPNMTCHPGCAATEIVSDAFPPIPILRNDGHVDGMAFSFCNHNNEDKTTNTEIRGIASSSHHDNNFSSITE